MILLSRLIKSQWATQNSEDKKVISIRVLETLTRNLDEDDVEVEVNPKELLEQARSEADSIVQDARLQADNMRNDLEQERLYWEQRKIEIAEAAKSEGFKQGLEEGRQQGYTECLDLINFSKTVVDSSKQDYLNKIESAEKTILHLGIKVAEKIIGLKLEEDEETFLAVVKRALKEAREYREIRLHVSPKHYDLLLSQKEELLAIFPLETDLYIYPDDEIQENGCIIESANGRIDASIDSQLQELKQKLLELLESE